MTARILFMLLCLVGSISSALAIEASPGPNAAEMASLPPYCQAKFTLPLAEWGPWRDRIGQNFNDIHHYCFALTAVNRYWGARTKADRGFYLQRALNNFEYMVNALRPDFALGAELYSDRGNLFKLMGRPGEAAKDFRQAMAINPKFVRSYLQLADLQAAGKSKKDALKTVTEGLRHVPDSTALQRRYLELGGKKPFPDPIVAKAAEPQPAQTEPAAPPPAAEPATAVERGPESAAPTTAPPAIGTPKNPYCRFCPPE